MGNSSKVNRLNDLSAQEWMKFTKTWFIHNPVPRKKNEVLHPAKYPEKLIEEFVSYFTKKGEIVLDPFVGTGSTLLACIDAKRKGIGLELQEKYVIITEERLRDSKKGQEQVVLCANSAQLSKIWKKNSYPSVDFIITSPPYGPMLRKKGLISKSREESGLDTHYSENIDDLGNAKSYDEFLSRLVNVFIQSKDILKKNHYLVVILQNYMDKEGYKMLAWDFAREMSKYFEFRGEKIWCQDNKTLYPYGYRYSFVPNIHHHYCLIFRNSKI